MRLSRQSYVVQAALELLVCEGCLKLSYNFLLNRLVEVATHWEQCACGSQKDRQLLLGSLLLKGLNSADPLVACVSTQWPSA